MTNFVAPWSPNFTNVVNDAVTTVEDVVNQVVPGVLPQPPSPAPAPQPAPSPAPAPAPSTDLQTVQDVINQIPLSQGGLVGNLAGSLEDALKQAWPAIQPQLQQDAMAYLQSYVAQVLQGNTSPQIPNITYDGQSLTRSAAKGHAWRTFLIGMSTSAISAVLTAVGSEAHLDFFSRTGWIATASIAAGTLVQTVASYLARLKIEPGFEQQLAAAPPSMSLQLKK